MSHVRAGMYCSCEYGSGRIVGVDNNGDYVVEDQLRHHCFTVAAEEINLILDEEDGQSHVDSDQYY